MNNDFITTTNNTTTTTTITSNNNNNNNNSNSSSSSSSRKCSHKIYNVKYYVNAARGFTYELFLISPFYSQNLK